MDYISEITKIVEAGLQQDSIKVYNYGNLLIEKLNSANDVRSARVLQKVVQNNKTFELKAKNLTASKLPVDSESRLSLAEIEKYTDGTVFLSVSENIKRTIDEYIELIDKSEKLMHTHVKVYRALLMYGPPGVGKTQAAKYIASKTNLPLVTVRVDGLISSYLGSTAKNIRKLFDFVSRTPCILFLDEFDSIAKMRDDSNELGELKRVVNTLLQNIDSISNKVPIIAATNHQHLLDSAVWRRFDYRLLMELPNEIQRIELIITFLEDIEVNDKLLNILGSITSGLSGSDIETFCNDIKTNLLLEKIEKIDEKSILDIFILFKNRNLVGDLQNYNNDEENKIVFIKSFRGQNKKLFNYRTLSKMSGISTGKLSKIMSEGDV